MHNENYIQTLNEIYKYDGVLGVVRYFVNHEKLSIGEAKLKASRLGYVPVSFSNTTTDQDKEDVIHHGLEAPDETTETLFRPSFDDEVTLKNLPKEEKGFFRKLLGL